MVGIVLCGGQSTRMGSDKGLKNQEENTWARVAKEKLAALEMPVKISVNNEQLEKYSELFSPADLIKDDAVLPIRGPLLGVLSAHRQFPQEDLFILACDMILMETSVLEELFSAYQQHPSAKAFVFTNGAEPEPLCGIYTSKGLLAIMDLLNSGRLTRHSMKFALHHLELITLPIMDEQKKYFQNFNTHAALNGL